MHCGKFFNDLDDQQRAAGCWTSVASSAVRIKKYWRYPLTVFISQQDMGKKICEPASIQQTFAVDFVISCSPMASLMADTRPLGLCFDKYRKHMVHKQHD